MNKPALIQPLTDHEHAQLQHFLKHTTAADRINLMEEMRLAFGMDHLKKARDLKEMVEDRPE
ncbi:MAG TPA: hypothetical protein VGB55_07250 [Tepidisphaeraceae bacterium]|jgi:hypothetical protein